MGLRYLGPIDGHDLPLLISTLEFAKTCDHPSSFMSLPRRQGLRGGAKEPGKVPWPWAYDVATGATLPAKPGAPAQLAGCLRPGNVKLCQKDNTIVGITAAMPTGTSLKILEKAMPDRYYDVGIAEEHAVLFACGMATMVSIRFARFTLPFCSAPMTALSTMRRCRTAGDFLHGPRRLSPQDGPTHHGLFDISTSVSSELHRDGAQGRG